MIAMVIGLLRPPFGSEDHDHHTAVSSVAMHDDGAVRGFAQVADDLQQENASQGEAPDGDHADRHDSGDHSHVASIAPPFAVVPAGPDNHASLVIFAASSMRTASSSFERPPRSVSLA
ncbi:hypothetical protein E0H22_15425 [Rhodopseudomonas boonkerdii]|uniref:hypothetical protein n=1 Tax=Rhodopseudomonas boonkerdii TaxID=475937 RepID=UPI001E2874E7|nr:hypothetical protein [Rhodopseudomonas boonkerdii]UGV26954.1 hypothetical protein E0H22_15425 [Rhodopseudomonas boonkerdii]